MPSNTFTALVAAAVAPVALITSAAILLSGFSAKYSGLSGQMRVLAAEYRHADTTPARRANIRQQLVFFRRRITAMWAASIHLSLALLSFLGTVLSVIFAQRAMQLGVVGLLTILVGLVLMASAVLMELYEVRLARLTTAGDLEDVFSERDTRT